MAFLRAGSAFSRVVETDSNDIIHMMDALKQLERAFTVRIGVAAATSILSVAAFLFAMLFLL